MTTTHRTKPAEAHDYAHGTWLAPEAHAYPNGGQTRRGLALWPDGELRAVRAGIPDTFFSIPAHGRRTVEGKERYVRGFLTIDTGFVRCQNPHPDGQLHCEECQFGLVDSPTFGALIFHPYQEA